MTEEELLLWEEFIAKAGMKYLTYDANCNTFVERGHKDGTWAPGWKDLYDQVSNFPTIHLQHAMQSVRSDLGRTFLWCCASRGWEAEAKWALSLGSDPSVDVGKGSAVGKPIP